MEGRLRRVVEVEGRVKGGEGDVIRSGVSRGGNEPAFTDIAVMQL